MKNLTKKHADEIREMWQSRALRASHGLLRKILITALAKEWPGALEVLLKVTFPGFVDIDRPLIAGYAMIAVGGQIVCDVIDRAGVKCPKIVYETEDAFLLDMRRLADRLKLNDADRIAMFTVLQKWVARDQRIGINGQRLAS